MKKTLIATALVFLVWGLMDFLIHGVILRAAHAASPELWRPRAEMKLVLLYLTVLVSALCFCTIYAKWIYPKSAATGFLYGLWFGIAVGVGMGFGTYSVQPIPYAMAVIWFLGTVVEGAVAGAITASLIRD